jgi:hypothetical protein
MWRKGCGVWTETAEVDWTRAEKTKKQREEFAPIILFLSQSAAPYDCFFRPTQNAGRYRFETAGSDVLRRTERQWIVAARPDVAIGSWAYNRGRNQKTNPKTTLAGLGRSCCCGAVTPTKVRGQATWPRKKREEVERHKALRPAVAAGGSLLPHQQMVTCCFVLLSGVGWCWCLFALCGLFPFLFSLNVDEGGRGKNERFIPHLV